VTWSEERLHRWLEERAGAPGDDVAFVGASRGGTVVCVDQVVAGVHFEAGGRLGPVGAKAASRALSDLAASAARPRALLAAVTAPPDTSERSLRTLIGAIGARGETFGAPLVGGDLAQADGPLVCSVTAIGELRPRVRPPARDRGRAGDVLIATGAFGGSLLGRHLKIEPRLKAGAALVAAGARALIDVSDGLARDVARMARASGVGAEIDHVPIHADARRASRRDGASPEEHALFDGEDHELVAAVPARRAAALLSRWRGAVPVARIGRLVPGTGLRIHGVRWNGRGGWVHGVRQG